MVGENPNMEKTTNPNMEKTMEIKQESGAERNEKIIQHMATVLLNSLVRATNIADGYKDLLDVYIDNPFYIVPKSDVIKFRVEIESGVKLPRFISYFMFGAIVVVKEIEINGSDITIYYQNSEVDNSAMDRYIINLDYKRLPIKDLAILIYIMYNLPMNSASSFTLSIQWYKDYIEQEKREILKMLKNNEIEINE